MKKTFYEELDLLPCPFCGGVVDVVKIPIQENEVYTYFSDRYCVRCEYTGMEQGCGVESGHYKTIVEAIMAWNTRVESD